MNDKTAPDKTNDSANDKIRIVLATHNEGKLPEVISILKEKLGEKADRIELVTAGSLNLPDPVEDGTTFSENALIKARFVARRTGLPALADDSGLIADVMGAAPGILSSRWAGKHGDDEANNKLLLSQLEDIPDDKRTARFRCAAALAVPAKKAGSAGSAGSAEFDAAEFDIDWQAVETGEMPGRIIRSERGENGFGYDPIFVPDEQEAAKNSDADISEYLTSAQLSSEQKNAISHRGKAVRAIAEHVGKLL